MIFSSYSLLILSNCALPWQTGREGDMLPVTYREVGKRQAKKTEFIILLFAGKGVVRR